MVKRRLHALFASFSKVDQRIDGSRPFGYAQVRIILRAEYGLDDEQRIYQCT